MFLTDIYSNDGEKEEEADQTLQVSTFELSLKSDLVSIWYRKTMLQKVLDFRVQKFDLEHFIGLRLVLIFGLGGLTSVCSMTIMMVTMKMLTMATMPMMPIVRMMMILQVETHDCMSDADCDNNDDMMMTIVTMMMI